MADAEFQHLLLLDSNDGGEHDHEEIEDGDGNGLLELNREDVEDEDDPEEEDLPDVAAFAALRNGELSEEQYQAAAAGLPLNLPFLLNRVSPPQVGVHMSETNTCFLNIQRNSGPIPTNIKLTCVQCGNAWHTGVRFPHLGGDYLPSRASFLVSLSASLLALRVTKG